MELDLKKAQEFQLQFDRMEVDTIETAAKVRKFFKQDYPKLMRVAGVGNSFLKSPVITDEPKAPSFGNNLEERIVKRVYAQETLERVIEALNAIRDESKQILIAVYVDDLGAWEICERLGCEETQYRVKKRKAENEFADAFETCCPWWKDLHKYK
ncbi:ArpU family phage packaging/lysis transcriptional regulator [Ligilactobacillus murinus]|uniref:ArpU family transcriptional regulator n=1 Tax=Ligilactobacillus murinus TaxID=1622 RepID=A0AAD0L3C7_9LACO|nr:ArpU family phage packaging/lysis transcriptional regulator [Ligilactobacillus murinus]AWZ37945.1 ArpU family transcriptional regulator [Ligilactobacillus murinus]AWZ41064.1 ArpU family transcriptional regulator [Ligilactobacillus murinus]